jgi:HK97 family phage major capsid protein
MFKHFGEHLRALKDGNQGAAETSMKAMQAMESKTYLAGSAAAGGNLVPETLAAEILRRVRKASPLYEDARRTVVDGLPSSYKRVVSDLGTTSGWVGEGATRSATGTAQFTKVAFPDGLLYARPSASEEVIQGSAYNLAEFVASEVSRAFASAINEAIISGDGSSKPQGFLHDAPAATADDASPPRGFYKLQYFPTGSTTGFGGDFRDSPPGDPAAVFYDTVFSLKPEYLGNAAWYMSGATLASVAKLKDGDGRSLLQPQMSAGVGPLLLGYPVRQSDHMQAIAENAYPIAFGSMFDAYEIVEGGGLRVTVDDSISTPGTTSWYVRRFISAKTVMSDALRVIKISAS